MSARMFIKDTVKLVFLKPKFLCENPACAVQIEVKIEIVRYCSVHVCDVLCSVTSLCKFMYNTNL